MKYRFSFVLAAIISVFPSLALAANVIAIYAPNLDFKDGAERNAYVNKIAKELSAKTGMSWEGQSFARAVDFEAAKSSVDAVILDADYFSSKGGTFRPVAMLSSNGQTTRPLKLIAAKGGSDKLFSYRGKKVAVVANSTLASAFITASALGNEAKATDYFTIDEVRDVRSAINALEVGKADLALVFDGYDSGFKTVYTSSPVGLPIIAVNSSKLTSEQAEKLKNALQNINIHTASFVTGSASYNAADASAYRRISSAKRTTSLSYQPIEPESTSVSLSSLKFSERNDGIIFNPFQVQYIPTIAEFDKKLEQRL